MDQQSADPANASDEERSRADTSAEARSRVGTSAEARSRVGTSAEERSRAGTSDEDRSRAGTSGEERYRAGDHAWAAAIFARLAEANPDDPAPLRMLGLCRLRLGDNTAALELLAKAVALAPADPYAQLHYGLGLHTVGRHQEATAYFRASAPLLAADPAPYLNLSSALLALNNTSGALDAARRARRRAPEMPEVHYTLGKALFACERFADAAEAFAVCLRLAPDFADAWVNAGISCYRGGDIEAAKKAMRRALAVAPGHRTATTNLVTFLRLSGEAEAGEAMLRDLIARDPSATEARLNMVAELMQEERSAEALALLDAFRPTGDPPLERHWALQRARTLLQLGRVAEAREIVAAMADMPPGLRPLLLWLQVLLATARKDATAASERAEEMEASLAAGPAILPEHRVMAHFELAGFWNRRDSPDRAFMHWRDGHRLLAPMQPFSRGASSAFTEATMARFDQARLRDGPRAGNRDKAPVFIVGMPRSGTTLTEQIIGAHAQAFGAGELTLLGRTFNQLGGRQPDGIARVAALGEAALTETSATYLKELHALAPEADRIVDKMPGNLNYLGLAATLLPGARIIHCVRDPRDIGLSIFTFRFFGYHPYAHDLGDLGWYIAQQERLMAHWRAVLPNPILTVRLTDWVNDFATTLKRVLEFLELPHDPACERFYEQETRVRTVSRAQVRQPINARGIGRWRRYEKHLLPLIEALAEGGALPPDDPGLAVIA